MTIRPVRTISRKGLVPLTGWIEPKSDSGNRITGFVDGKGSFNVPNPSRVRSHRNVIRRSSGQVVVEAGKREMRSSIEDFDRAEAEAAIRWRHAA